MKEFTDRLFELLESVHAEASKNKPDMTKIRATVRKIVFMRKVYHEVREMLKNAVKQSYDS